MKRWPKKSPQQIQQDRERKQRELATLMQGLADDVLDLLCALVALDDDAWDDPLYQPLVEKVEAELSATAALQSDGLAKHAHRGSTRRQRPRLPSLSHANASTAEKDQALRVLNGALGIVVPDDERKPKKRRRPAKLRAKLRRRREEAAEGPQDPTESYLRFWQARRRPRPKPERAALKTPQQGQPATVEADRERNPWLYDEMLWE